jgi:hypothetical protein
LVLALSLAACGGGNDNTGSNTPSDNGGSSTTTPPASTPSENNGGDVPDGASPYMDAGVLAKQTSKSIEEVVGKTETGKRLVTKLSDDFLNTASQEYPPSAEYSVYTFGDDGLRSDNVVYYVFDSKENFWGNFNDATVVIMDETRCREWSEANLYYGFRAPLSLEISWDDAWNHWLEYQADTGYYILIQ